MKKLLLSLFLISGITYGQGDPAPYIKGQAATGLGNQASTVFVPNQQSTKINAYQARIETGNGNLLSNPSFEAGTYNSGWTCSLGSTALETTAKTDGNKANAINSIGAGVRCYQTSTTNAANLKGLLGSAIVKIKTTDSIYKVCGLVDGNAAANERNCITVKPTSADLPFYPARTDFYMGGTSNGIVVYTTTTTSQPTVIDDAFVGVFNGGLSQFSNNTGWTAFTPSWTTSAGTLPPTSTSVAWKKRVGTDLWIRFYNLYTGAGTGSGRLGLTMPDSLSIAATAGGVGGSGLQGLIDGGSWYDDSASGVTDGRSLSAYAASSTKIELVATDGSITLVNTAIGASDRTGGLLKIPIAGWEANTNASIAGCVDAFGCTDTLTAKIVTGTGAFSNENIPWISSCTAANPTVCTLRTAVVNGLTCTFGGSGGTTFVIAQTAATTTTVAFGSYLSTTGATTPLTINVSCTKNGSDFKPKTVVVSPLQGYVKVPGVANPVIVSATINSGCTSVTSQDGVWITSASSGGVGQCTINIVPGFFSSAPRCWVASFATDVAAGEVASGIVTNTSTVFRWYQSQPGVGGVNRVSQVTCKGEG